MDSHGEFATLVDDLVTGSSRSRGQFAVAREEIRPYMGGGGAPDIESLFGFGAVFNKLDNPQVLVEVFEPGTDNIVGVASYTFSGKKGVVLSAPGFDVRNATTHGLADRVHIGAMVSKIVPTFGSYNFTWLREPEPGDYEATVRTNLPFGYIITNLESSMTSLVNEKFWRHWPTNHDWFVFAGSASDITAKRYNFTMTAGKTLTIALNNGGAEYYTQNFWGSRIFFGPCYQPVRITDKEVTFELTALNDPDTVYYSGKMKRGYVMGVSNQSTYMSYFMGDTPYALQV